MATEYVKALRKFDVLIKVVGRNEKTSNTFGKENGVEVIVTAIEKLNLENVIVINAVSFENLADVNKQLLNNGAKIILSEKPAGLNSAEVKELETLTKNKNSQLFVAYNRRHFPSVTKLKELLSKEKLSSAHFEFTEWGHVIEKLNKPKVSLENWFYGNSTHVIDLFVHLAGLPKELSTYKTGQLNWHPKGSVFSGAGITQKNISFSYDANWESAGRWGLDICTDKGKYSLRPLEKLFFTPKGSVQQGEIEIASLHPDLKPGLFEQLNFLLNGKHDELLSIDEHFLNCQSFYDRILDGK